MLFLYALLITKTCTRPSTLPSDIELIFIMPAFVIVEHEPEPTDVSVCVFLCVGAYTSQFHLYLHIQPPNDFYCAPQ